MGLYLRLTISLCPNHLRQSIGHKNYAANSFRQDKTMHEMNVSMERINVLFVCWITGNYIINWFRRDDFKWTDLFWNVTVRTINVVNLNVPQWKPCCWNCSKRVNRLGDSKRKSKIEVNVLSADHRLCRLSTLISPIVLSSSSCLSCLLAINSCE